MSTDPSILLRMLEPAVRPDGNRVSGAPGRSGPGGVPFEQTSFEQLLKDAQGPAGTARLGDEIAASNHHAGQSAAKPPADPLAGLDDVDRIENAALRLALAEARPAQQPGQDQ
ncbi:MAG: hypothetical protein AAGH88_09975 [Planctomycetota bacterium]